MKTRHSTERVKQALVETKQRQILQSRMLQRPFVSGLGAFTAGSKVSETEMRAEATNSYSGSNFSLSGETVIVARALG
ncbi:hypothetical protein E2C01_069457 [Portunus trituberculatus]|uniref:Uncharacterized protein n=1 Tax=Portunus trituberculatus TaxID=210409 RepID=A0A5B7HYL3_PORTR|nr:hypothetical protein [Portunus trituberculatus]